MQDMNRLELDLAVFNVLKVTQKLAQGTLLALNAQPAKNLLPINYHVSIARMDFIVPTLW